MDEITKLLLINLPLVAVLALWINRWIERLYNDFRTDRDVAAEERADIKMRLKRLEEHIIGDSAPTLTNRPKESDNQ